MDEQARREQILDELYERAAGVESNPDQPGQPSMIGLLVVAMSEIADISLRLETIEDALVELTR